MKAFAAFAAFIMTIVFPLCGYSGELGDLYLKHVEGDVQVMTEETTDWVPASMNLPIREGDRLWVPDGGRAELKLQNGTVIRIGEETSLEVLLADPEVFQFYLDEGHAYVTVADSRDGKGQAVFPETPGGSFKAYGRSRFRVDVAEEGRTELSVLQGEVYVDQPKGQMKAVAGERLVLRAGSTYPELAGLKPPDQWEQWNRNRDKGVSEAVVTPGTRYLPEDLRPYAADLDSNGSWVSSPDYGYIWAPTVVHVSSWAPYQLGRWVWIGGDYVWISYEPWGWAPYHYGRWVHVDRHGWCWVPPRRGSVYWGPGYVGWVHTPTHVSWVPLAPGETYYHHGRRNYGPHSINITNITVNKVVIKGGYRNARHGSAVTTMHRDGFLGGRGEHVRIRESTLLGNHEPMGPPRIKPGREGFMPVVKVVPEGKRPPSRFSHSAGRETVRERRLAVFGSETGKGRAIEGRSAAVDTTGKSSREESPSRTTVDVRRQPQPVTERQVRGRRSTGDVDGPRERRPAGRSSEVRREGPGERSPSVAEVRPGVTSEQDSPRRSPRAVRDGVRVGGEERALSRSAPADSTTVQSAPRTEVSPDRRSAQVVQRRSARGKSSGRDYTEVPDVQNNAVQAEGQAANRRGRDGEEQRQVR